MTSTRHLYTLSIKPPTWLGTLRHLITEASSGYGGNWTRRAATSAGHSPAANQTIEPTRRRESITAPLDPEIMSCCWRHTHHHTNAQIHLKQRERVSECREHLDRCVWTHVNGVRLLRSLLPDSDHLPVQHPWVRQVNEELAVCPADVQNAMRVIHRGDVRRLGSWEEEEEGDLHHTFADTLKMCRLDLHKKYQQIKAKIKKKKRKKQ